jgi:hypothetical protein
VHENVLNTLTDPERIDSPDDVKKVAQQTAQFLGGKSDPYFTQRLTAPLRRQLASELGLTEDQLLNTPVSHAVSPEQIEAVRMVLEASRDKLSDAMQAAAKDSSMQQGAFDALAKHQMIKEVFEGQVKRQAGRALQASGPTTDMDSIAESLSRMSDSAKREAIRRFSLLDKDNPAAIEKLAREIKPSSTGDKIYEAWINSLVSGGAFARKFLGDTAMEVVNKPTKVMAGILDYVRSKATGTPQERFIIEATPSKLAGIKEGWQTFVRTFNDEISLQDRSRNEFAPRDIAIKGKLGKVIRIPTRLLAAITDGEHVVNYSSQMTSIAMRMAVQQVDRNLGPMDYVTAVAKRAAEIRQNPTPEMRAEAEKYAQTQTLQQGFEGPGLYNNTMRAVSNLKNNGGVWKYLFPFVKTPANVVRESWRYSPLGLASTAKGVMFDGLKGGELSDALAKNVLGTGAFLYALEGALHGKITGAGPGDPMKRAALEATGWQPYSIKTSSGRYISWKGLPPVYMTVGLAADIAEAIHENSNDPSIGPKMVATWSKFKDMGRDVPFLNSMAEITNLWEGRQNVGSTLANEIVPAGIRNIAHIVDPTVRKPSGVLQSFESQIPFASKNVPPKTDIAGQPIQRPASALGGFNPYPVTTETTDQVLQEQARLSQLPKPPTKLQRAGVQVETPREKTQLDAQDAIQLHDDLGKITANQNWWKTLPDPQKQQVIQRLKDRIARSRAARLLELRKGSNPQPSQATNSWQVVAEQPAN